jgi:ParB family chromosome partitioning protein
MSNGLGRGLGSLIPNKKDPAYIAPTPAAGDGKDRVLQVAVEAIDPNPRQPRKDFNEVELSELVESIKEYGVIQPLIVTSKAAGRYELIAGERRLRASKEAGLKTVPVILREAAEEDKLELALIENIQREDLNPIELGAAYKKLMDEFHLTQEQVARKVGKARPSVANIIRYLSLPDEIQASLIEGRITEAHAKYLAGLDTPEKQMSLFRKIIHNNLTVTDTEQEVRRIGGTKAARIKINYQDKDKEFAFRQFFGAKVEIKRKGRGGEIIIHYFSDEELEEIVGKVKK